MLKITKKDYNKKLVKDIKQCFSQEENENMQKSGRERYKNLPENEKKMLFKYLKIYYKMRKNVLL